MKYIKAEWDERLPGFHVDATQYLEELPTLQHQLPAGAWEFASDVDHYSFRSSRCVKDLELSGIEFPTSESEALTIKFAPNAWKHDHGLVIEYMNFSHFSVDREQSIDWMQADTIILDEIIPAPEGCQHEIALADSTITIRCADLRATWTE